MALKILVRDFEYRSHKYHETLGTTKQLLEVIDNIF